MPNGTLSDREMKLGYFLIFIGVSVGSVALGFLVHGTENAAWRTAGGLLEVLGLARAALAVDTKVARVSGRPRFAERLRRRLQVVWAWVVDLLGREKKGRTVTLTAEAGSSSIAAGDARISARPPEDAPVERWIEYLDEEVQALRERLQKIQRKYRERMDRLSEQLKETRRQLRAADQEVEDLLERLAIGGFEWELVGLGWFLVGVVAATWGAQIL